MLTTTRKLRAAEARAEAAEARCEAAEREARAIAATLPIPQPGLSLAEQVDFLAASYRAAKDTIDLQDKMMEEMGERNAQLVKEHAATLVHLNAIERELAPLKAAEEKRLEGLRKGNEARRAEAQQRRNLKLVAPAEAVAA